MSDNIKKTKHKNKSKFEINSQLYGAKILLVEDEPSSQEFESRVLKDYGFEVSIANNGQEALKLLKQEKFDGILMDYQMPIMDGYIAAGKIREQEHLKDLPIIAITANITSDDREKVLACGMNDMVPKPIIIAELFEAMNQWIKPKNSLTAINTTVNKKKPAGSLADLKLSTLNKLKLTAIDTKLGLELCEQNISLYVKLLDLFYQSQNQFVTQFNTAKSDSNFKEMKSFAHALKGASSTIGAVKLQQTALTLESACYAENKYQEKYFSLLTIELNLVLAEIERITSNYSNS